MPLAISETVGEGLGAGLALEAIVVADLLSNAAALQFKVAKGEGRGSKSNIVSEAGCSARRNENIIPEEIAQLHELDSHKQFGESYSI